MLYYLGSLVTMFSPQPFSEYTVALEDLSLVFVKTKSDVSN